MKYVLSNQEMQQTDQETIHSIGIMGAVLMERASEACARQVVALCHQGDVILCVAGIGNNGGDAIACARILLEWGYDVDYCVVGDVNHASNDLKDQLSILTRLGYAQTTEVIMGDYDVIVDGIFGVGLSREVGGDFREAILAINASGASVIAVDIPSGISGDNGKVQGVAVHADVTVTFGGYKSGHLLYPGRQYCGTTHLAAIGFHESTLGAYAHGVTWTKEDNLTFPPRFATSNKGSYGKVLVVAGNETMSGAAILAANAAYHVGAGLVKVISPEANRGIIQGQLPEVLFGTRDQLAESIDWCDVILFGPGVGASKDSKDMLAQVLTCEDKPLVIDADGLNLLSQDPQLKIKRQQLILTPHLLEAARLLQVDLDVVKDNLKESAENLCKNYHGTVILKDATTLVSSKEELLYYNQSGNEGMSTGGSGDVLGGIVAGLLGQKMSAYDASCLGVYLHGVAGDLAKEAYTSYSMMASNLVDYIGPALKKLGGE